MQPDFGSIGAYRTRIGADSVALFSNITPEFASPLGQRTIAERARSAVYLGVDAVLISGPITGMPTDIGQLRAAKAAVPRVPGAGQHRRDGGHRARDPGRRGRRDRRHDLKRDAVTWNPVDPARAASLHGGRRRRARARWRC